MTTVRERIVAQALWGAAHEPDIHYAETRPIPLAAWRAGRLPLTTDCSGFATCCYYAAGAPDPNGSGYDGQGYTGTLLSHGHAIPLADACPGDLAVFGASPGVHVVVVTDHGHTCVSHGTEAGPRVSTLAAEWAGFPGQPMTVLRFMAPDPAPAPAIAWRWRVLVGGNSIYRGSHLAGALALIAAEAKKHDRHAGWEITLNRMELK